MGTSKASALINTFKKSVIKHSPEILTGIGIAGMVTSTIFAVASTPKALRLIEKAKEERNDSEKISPLDVVKVTWKCYVPSAAIGLAGIGCLVAANSVHLRRNAAITMAYTLSESALHEYRAKVVETIGEKKEEEVRDAIAKDKIEKTPVSTSEIYITEKGNTLCFDTISGRYFSSDIDKIKQILNELNRRMLLENYVSLNDFYYEIGLGNIDVGDDIGWNIDKGFIDVSFSAQIADDNRPCIVLDYDIAPYHNYDR